MKTKDRKGEALSELVSRPTAHRPLSKNQKAFKALLRKVESLREAIETEEAELDATLDFYASELFPRVTRQTELQKDLVRGLAPYVNKSFFPGREERLQYKELLRDLLDEISTAEKGLGDADLREIYNVVHGVGYAKDELKAIAGARAALAKMFAEAGIEADLTELDCVKSEIEFMQKAEQLIARMQKMKEVEAEAAHCAESGHHGSEDETLRAEEEFRKRSIANIYKQLARVLHPDFEQDKERQKEKVLLMQELTEAYRHNDLHTLLRLEMQWIENESGDLARLTEEKLEIYNEVLAGQASGLEAHLRNLIYHPRYRPVVVFNNGLTRVIDGTEKARDLDRNIAAIERSITLTSKAQSADDVREAIRILRT